jgi:hypothetical protein
MSLGIGPHEPGCECYRCENRRTMAKDELTQAYIAATKLAMEKNQVFGPDNQYFVTLQQLESIFLRLKAK